VFHIILFQPEIPPNTGNVIRLCANAGAHLHLVKPLGFSLDDKYLARSGMDYRDLADTTVHENWEACRAALGERRYFLVSTKAETRYDTPCYRPGDAFVFGPESRGLPAELLASALPELRIRLPMAAGNRSLNLGNSVAVTVYEAWRQNGFAGGS
jgi:tRNA (cytidine/uridine-2'-O-)-methyltransferase